MQYNKTTYYDLEQILGLQPEGWPDIKEEFRQYIKSDFCNPIKVSLDNKIIGLGTSILFKNTAWIAHIIVSKEYRNQGIGFQIVENLLTDLKSKSIDSVLLIATELGEPLYKKAGFRPVTDYRWFKREQPWNNTAVSKNIVPYTKDLYPEIINLDKLISGEDRESLIRIYLDNCLVYLNDSKINGFYLPDLGEGLLFANNPEAGMELMKVKYSKADKAVLPSENFTGIDFLKQNGFEELGTKGKRMILGKDISWKPDCIYSRIGGNYG